MIWTILRVVGICLLVLLLVILVLLVILLAEPFTYDVRLERREETKFSVTFHSLLSCFHGLFDEQQKFSLFILWRWRLFPKKEKQDAFTTFEEYEDQEDEGVSLKEMQMRSATETEAEEKAQGVFSNHVGQKRHTKQSKDKNHKKVTQNVSNTKDKGKKLLDFLGDVAYRRAISYIGKELIYLLKKWMPRRFMADFGFAMPSPDQTGYVLGAISCIPLRNAQIKRLDPDFLSEDPYFEGELQCQGKIQLYVVVFALLRLVMKKECRKLFHYLGGE